MRPLKLKLKFIEPWCDATLITSRRGSFMFWTVVIYTWVGGEPKKTGGHHQKNIRITYILPRATLAQDPRIRRDHGYGFSEGPTRLPAA